MNEQDESPENQYLSMSRNELFMISLISGLVYISIGLVLIYYFHEIRPLPLLLTGWPIYQQVGIGLGAGMLAAAIAIFFIYRPPLSRILHDFTIIEFISHMKLTRFDRSQASIIAGIGEEFLFRGTIQPLLGIWWTSLIFIAIHGYIQLKSIGHIIFTVLMFGLSVGLGLLYEWAGLIAAMVAHMVYDFLLLEIMHRWGIPGQNESQNP